MSHKMKALPGATFLRSFAELPKAAIVGAIKERQFVAWSPEGMMLRIVGEATETLQTWLTARLGDLLREKVPLESITVHHFGNRTVIRVDNVDRFEFKLKVQMEGK